MYIVSGIRGLKTNIQASYTVGNSARGKFSGAGGLTIRKRRIMMKKNMRMRMVRVEGYEYFDPAEFIVSPAFYGLSCANTAELIKQATELAKTERGICIAVVTDEVGQFAVATTYGRHNFRERFLLFNAAECSREDAEMRAVTLNTGRGALSAYLYDKWIKYEPGSIL